MWTGHALCLFNGRKYLRRSVFPYPISHFCLSCAEWSQTGARLTEFPMTRRNRRMFLRQCEEITALRDMLDWAEENGEKDNKTNTRQTKRWVDGANKGEQESTATLCCFCDVCCDPCIFVFTLLSWEQHWWFCDQQPMTVQPSSSRTVDG